jgi:hypothetical protein
MSKCSACSGKRSVFSGLIGSFGQTKAASAPKAAPKITSMRQFYANTLPKSGGSK